MNRHYESDNDLQELRESGARDREISLGTATILGIFFLLALLCAVFFGFGYSMGRRSSQTIISTSETRPAVADSTEAKPAPGSPANRSAAVPAAGKAMVDENDAPSTAENSTAPSGATAANVPSSSRSLPTNTRYDSSGQAQTASSIKPISMPRPAAPSTAALAPGPVPGLGTIVVQVAAVSHQEDADLLMNALKKRGYSVAIRQFPQDKLLHVQIGPFASRKDADTMRQRLQADGYNAIVK